MTKFDRSRRNLVTGIAAAAAAGMVSASSPASGASPRRDPRVGIAIVGLGSYAAFCIERLAMARNARPAAIVSGSRERALEVAGRYGIAEDAVYGYEDYARIAADERIDGVHICLPVGLHAEHALKSLAAGKHVLCEKPLAANVTEAQRVIAAAEKAGRVLMPAYRAWFSDAVQDAIRRVREGTHGALVSVDAHKGFAMAQPAGNWRFDPALSGGGCLTDIGIYSVQLQRWFAGGLPRRVSAIAHRAEGDVRFARVESDIGWLAEFDGGVLATGSASWRYRLQNRTRLGFAQAWLDIDPATPAIGERSRLGLDAPNRVEELMLPLRDRLPRMYDAFADACLGRAEAPVSAHQGLDDLRMIDAIYRAARTGRTVTL